MSLKIIVVLSLAANLALGYMAFRNQTPPTSPPLETTPSATQPPAPATTPSPMAAAPAAIGTNVPAKRFDWQSVESADYKEYIANLRAIGCPEETIKDIILADVNKMYDDKKRSARGPAKKFEYWKAGNPMMGLMGSPEDLKKGQEIEKERDATLATLGIQPDFRTQISSMMNPLETMFDFIPETKRAEVLKAMTSMQESMANSSGSPDARDIMKAQKEMEQKVKALLTPEEALQYDLRLSMTATMLRGQIDGFNPSEDEFLKVYQLRKNYDDQYSPLARVDEKDEERKTREAAEKILNSQIKEALGETRYTDYERAQDYMFQQMLKSARRGEVGEPQAIQAWEMKKMAEQKASEIRKQPNLKQPDRNAALAAIRAETETALQNTLGAKGWDEYNRPMNTHWLQNIYRDPPKPK